MTETNWADAGTGARIVDVSSESTNTGANNAANLLCASEDELWLAGPAPQHVSVALSSSHPPLLYIGWHVLLDSPTNPKVVEVASGPSLEQLKPILLCEALPGAGTQVWKLPRPIPVEHAVVRFKLLESFGSGPTYISTLVLLENDPGPDYTANGEASPTTSVSLKAAAPYISRCASTAVDRNARGEAGFIPLPLRVTPPSSGPSPPPPAGINTSTASRGGRYSDDGGRSDVGIFNTRSRTTTPTNTMNHPPSKRFDDPLQTTGPADRGRSSQTPSLRMRSNSRMSQLLRDLDDDIRLLKPIKTVSPGKHKLLYLSHETSGLQVDDDLDDDYHNHSRTPAPHHRHRGGSRGGDCSGSTAESDSDDYHHHRHSPEIAATRRGRGRVAEAEGVDKAGGVARHLHRGSSATSGVGSLPADPRLHPAHMDTAVYPPTALPPQPGGVPAINANYEARLNALEKAVAALNEAVQHQRDDLTMIKRLLLQQATERRKEADQRFAEKQRYESAFNAANGMMVASSLPTPPPPPQPPAAASPSVPGVPTAATMVAPSFMPDSRLTHHSITVDFPEDVLRAFVESVLDQRLRKHTKKVEAKLLHRLDKQLHDVIKALSATVEGQLSNLANVAAAGHSMSTFPSVTADQLNTSNVGGRTFSPMSQSSLMHGIAHNDAAYHAASSTLPRGDGGGLALSVSSKADVSHTPRSQTETGVSTLHPRVRNSKK
jgi:hypothetical protein